MEDMATSFIPANSSPTGLLGQCLLIYSMELLEKLTGSQVVKKFPAVYGTQKFITAFTSARHLSLS
jgi:hypothetical protein